MAEFDYKPGKSEEKLTEFIIKDLLIQSKKYDEPFRTRREDNRKFYKGDQWRLKQPKFKSKSVSNYLSLIIRDEVALLTDNPPQITVRPVDQKSDPSMADTLTKLMKHIMYVNRFRELEYKACKIGAIEGTVYFRPIWDVEAAEGKGDIKILVEKADCVYRDPSGEDNYFIIEKDITLAEVYRYYPDKAQFVHQDMSKSKILSNSDKKQPNLPVQSTDASRTVVYEGDNLEVSTQHRKVKIHMAWIKDNSTKELSKDNEKEKKKSGKEIKKEDAKFEKKYKYGRWVFIANGKIVVKDYACKTRHFPIVPFVMDLDPEDDINGLSNIDYTKKSQTDYNEMYALIKDWLRAVTYPRFKYDPHSQFDPKKMKNKWGAGIPVAPKDFAWDFPPPLPNDAFRFILENKTNIEYISGINDVTQGRRPSSVTAAKAIQLLQEASKTMLRPKARALEEVVKKVGELIVDLIQYGYSQHRIIRILGAGEPGEEISVNDKKVINDTIKITKDMSIGEFDVYVTPDSTLPTSRIEKFGMLLDLNKEGMADRKAILPETGLENWKEIDQRLDQKEQQAREQQAKAQQQQAQAEQAKQQQEMQIETGKLEIEKQKNDREFLLKEKELELKEKELELKEADIMVKREGNVLKSKKST